MDFIFSAPFRTYLNIDGRNPFAYTESALEPLIVAARLENQNNMGKLVWKVSWRKSDNGELRYSSLSEDSLPQSATPFLRLDISEDHLTSIFLERKLYHAIGEFQISECKALYYDNTVGILSLRVAIKNSGSKMDVFKIIDEWSTELCSSIIKLIYDTEESMRKRLSATKVVNRPLILDPKDFIVFFDTPLNPSATYAKYRERMLWTTRIFIDAQALSCSELHEALERWIQQPISIEAEIRLGNAQLDICVGNSIIFGTLSSVEQEDFSTALSVSTYFYVIHDVLNRNLRTIFQDISTQESVSDKTIAGINRIRGYIEYIQSDFNDVLMGLQGNRGNVARKMLEVWKYADLLNAVEMKKRSVGKVIDYILNEKRNRYGRFIEAILAAIGGVAILEFILNLFAFSADESIEQDSIPGIVDAARYLSVDGVLYAAIASLIFVLILIVRKG